MPNIEPWNRLTPAEQHAAWSSFIEALDAGDAGYHRHYPLLARLWERGDAPPCLELQQAPRRRATRRAQGPAIAADCGAPPF
jgi:hypothetical protein